MREWKKSIPETETGTVRQGLKNRGKLAAAILLWSLAMSGIGQGIVGAPGVVGAVVDASGMDKQGLVQAADSASLAEQKSASAQSGEPKQADQVAAPAFSKDKPAALAFTIDKLIMPAFTTDSLTAPASAMDKPIAPASSIDSLIASASTLDMPTTPTSSTDSLTAPASSMDKTAAPVSSADSLVSEPPHPALPDQPTVYLTFDDGPSSLTDKVLEILRQQHIKATFFVVGDEVKANPDRLRSIVKDGHSVGNHSYDHVYKELYGSFQNFASQIVKTELLIKNTANVSTRLLRAPGGTFGNFDKLYFDSLRQAGYIVFDWDVDSGDSERKDVPAAEIEANVEKAKLKRQMIVLMHDGSGHGETVKALPAIIAYFRQNGYTFGSLSEQVKPTVFRIDPHLKWQRENPDLATAVTWLGGENAASGDGRPAIPAVGGDTDMQTVLAAWKMKASELVRIGDTAYVPLRQWSAQNGGEAIWDGKTRTARIAEMGLTLELKPDSGTLILLDRHQKKSGQWKVKAAWIDGSLLLPFDDLRKAVGAPAANRSVALTLSKGQSYNSLN